MTASNFTITGAGFAALTAIRRLRKLDRSAHITVINSPCGVALSTGNYLDPFGSASAGSTF